MQCCINGKYYNYVTDIRNNAKLRHRFNKLSNETFGLSFEAWYQNGYWGKSYIPHVLLDGDKVVANVSVNLIDLVWQYQKKRYIQLGTVMTDAQYRNKGLARWLLAKVLDEWKNHCDAMFLYANDSVLDFYPKFGFIKAEEYQFEIPIHKKIEPSTKLDMSKSQDRELLLSLYRSSNPFSKLPVLDNPGLLMFYCTQFLRNNVYFIKACNAVVIAEHQGTNMLCYDVFCTQSKELPEILSFVAEEQTNRVVLGFTPIQNEQYKTKLYYEENTTLFVLKDKENIFENNKIMFPLLSHA